jgi:hypothetical protein
LRFLKGFSDPLTGTIFFDPNDKTITDGEIYNLYEDDQRNCDDSNENSDHDIIMTLEK